MSISKNVIAAEITTTIRHIPTELLLGPADGLPTKCVVNLDSVRTVPREYLSERISRLPGDRVQEVIRAVGYAFGWEELVGS